MSNPFFCGDPVLSNQFIDRRRELRRIAGRIVNQGQSTAVVGEPRSGKTSLLLYLSAPETRDGLYGSAGKQLFFSFLDSHALGDDCDQAQFWKSALQPFYEEVICPAADPGSPLPQAYRTCRENSFGTFTLEKLLAQVNATGWRLVLLLDEFDVLLYHPQLSCAEFFGGLRTLAMRSRGALALVTASRRSLTDLNRDTQQYSRTGSPYFNFLDEITLGSLPDKYVTELLCRAGDRFTPADRRFIVRVAGGHPYLLQAAASELWEAHAEGQDDPHERWQQVGQSLYGKATMILDNTWRLWSPATRKAFTIVALADVSEMLEQRRFFELPLTRDKRNVGRELRALAKQGFVSENKTSPVGWRVRPQAFLWWLVDEIVRTVRDETSFEDWLQKQELGFLLTRREKEQLDRVVRGAGELLKDGAATFIEAAAKGVVTAAGG
jgi:hypothetical protein